MGNCQANHHPRRSAQSNLPKEAIPLNSDLLDCIEANPSGKPATAVIWLRGLGADGNDFEPIVPQLRLPDSLPVRFRNRILSSTDTDLSTFL